MPSYFSSSSSNALGNGNYSDSGAQGLTVTSGPCARHCSTMLIVFLVVLFVVIVSQSICLSPMTMLLLKIVDERALQPFALGLMRCATILIGE